MLVSIYYVSADRFGINSAAGIHLLDPSRRELEDAIGRAQVQGFPTIYVYSSGH
jgi:hypothetical protein